MTPRVNVSSNITDFPHEIADLFGDFIREFCDNIARDFSKCPHISSRGIFDVDELLNIDIEISEKTPGRYRALGTGGFIEGIKKEWPGLPGQATEEIKETVGPQSINREWISDVAGIIARCADEPNEEIIKRVKDIINNPEYRHPSKVLGEYDHAKRVITLYHKSISGYAESAGRSAGDAYKAVYLHELFHAYHHLCGDAISRELRRRGDHTATVVKESLAAYFESRYDLQYDRSAWYLNFPANWPYAGAGYITNNHFFAEIFLTSLNDLDSALRKLLEYDMDAFYDVKNVK